MFRRISWRLAAAMSAAAGGENRGGWRRGGIWLARRKAVVNGRSAPEGLFGNVGEEASVTYSIRGW